MANKQLITKIAAIATSAAAALALVIGGTFAYLADSSGPVTNRFTPNSVDVELRENTGDTYNIVPGTTQPKDPTVTVNNTLNSYVFVEVEDNANGVVGYEIADGWELLSAEGNKKVYVREVAADADTKTFPVLKDNQVTYAATLTNSDLSGLTDPSLTFTAYVIQKEPFTNAADAWAQTDTADAPHATVTPYVIPEDGITLSTGYVTAYIPGITDFDIMPVAASTYELSDEDAAAISESPYSDWSVDFTVSFNNPIHGCDIDNGFLGDVLLFGNYAGWGNVPMVIQRDLAAGEEYRLMQNFPGFDGGLRMAYYEMPGITPFTCGATVKTADDNFSSTHDDQGVANNIGSDAMGTLPAGTTMTVKLNLYETDGHGNETGRVVTVNSNTYNLT